jgi:glycolate oxidase FAD binding subunit
MPATEVTPITQAELGRWLKENVEGPRRVVAPTGGRTALTLPAQVDDLAVIDLKELRRIVDYPARDMTITVEAGLPIAELQTQLAREGQRLPIDIPQASRATVGGAIACNTSGPRRFGHGTFRDYVLGISAADAQGRLFKGGGRVVKNVAGYDLCKLLVGSRGTLGVITQVTLKLKPLPAATGWWWFTFDTFAEMENVLERLLTSATRPAALEMLDSPAARLVAAESRLPLPCDAAVLAIHVEGTAREVAWQLDTLRKEVVPFGVQQLERLEGDAAAKLTAALTEFPVPTEEPLTFQANLLPSQGWRFAELATQLDVAVNCHAGNGVIVGQLPETVATIDQAMALLTPLQSLAREHRGNLQVLHCDREWRLSPDGGRLPLQGTPQAAWGLMQRLKTQLDPLGLLCPWGAYRGG